MTRTTQDYDSIAACLEQEVQRRFAPAWVLRYGDAVRRHQAVLVDELWYVQLPARQEIITIGVRPVWSARAGGAFDLQVRGITSEARPNVEEL